MGDVKALEVEGENASQPQPGSVAAERYIGTRSSERPLDVSCSSRATPLGSCAHLHNLSRSRCSGAFRHPVRH